MYVLLAIEQPVKTAIFSGQDLKRLAPLPYQNYHQFIINGLIGLMCAQHIYVASPREASIAVEYFPSKESAKPHGGLEYHLLRKHTASGQYYALIPQCYSCLTATILYNTR